MTSSDFAKEARALAQRFTAKRHESVRLPVFSFDDWRKVYSRPNDKTSLRNYRLHLRRNWYLFHYLRSQGIHVDPVPVRSSQFQRFVRAAGHDISNGHALAHAVGEYANRPETAISPCRHSSPDGETLGIAGPVYATLTVFGESENEPEVMVATVHSGEGKVYAFNQVLAVDHSPQEALEASLAFLEVYKPGKVFHDQTIRRSEYCADCNSLLVNVATPQDLEGPS